MIMYFGYISVLLPIYEFTQDLSLMPIASSKISFLFNFATIFFIFIFFKSFFLFN